MNHTERNIISDEINADYKLQSKIDHDGKVDKIIDQEKANSPEDNKNEVISDTKLSEEEIAGKKKYHKIIENEKSHC